MSMDRERRIEVFSRFIQQITRGVEGLEYQGKRIGSNVFLLSYIKTHEGCQMKDVSNYLDVNPSSATRRVEKLVKTNLITRKVSTDDRRSVLLELTSEGENLYSQFIQNRQMSLKSFKEMFKPEEVETFFRVLEQMVDMVSKHLTLDKINDKENR